jgi:hypothetical protein
MKNLHWTFYGVPCVLGLLACDGTQYVSPDTVALSITKDSSGGERVYACNYVPVLLGSEVKSRYVVEGDVKATLTVTRDSCSVVFEGTEVVEPFVTPITDLEDAPQTAPSPPVGYTVKLSIGCAPKD